MVEDETSIKREDNSNELAGTYEDEGIYEDDEEGPDEEEFLRGEVSARDS